MDKTSPMGEKQTNKQNKTKTWQLMILSQTHFHASKIILGFMNRIWVQERFFCPMQIPSL